jgi:predicted ArsR family transcriptional regulator
LCQEPVTVADVAADLDLPLGVVRVLLGDLIQAKLISVRPRPTARPQASYNLLQEVLDGLRAL